MASKKLKIRNRIIVFLATIVIGYILLVNNSLDFLIKFGLNVNQNAVAFIGFFIILAWTVWKKERGVI